MSVPVIDAIPQTPSCTALVTDLSGTVMVRKAGKADFVKGVWGLQLSSGDQLRTQDNSSATLLFQNSSLITLGSKSSLTIADNLTAGSRKSIKVPGGERASNLSLLTFRESRNGEAGALAGLRSAPDGTDITPISPRNSKLKSGPAEFAWTSTRSYESFTVTVLSDTGIFWRRRTTASPMDYPKDAPLPEPGRPYFWSVAGQDLFDHGTSVIVRFTVLPLQDLTSVQEQEQRLQQAVGGDPENTSLQFLLGGLYDQQGLLTEAIVQFRHIAEKNPAAPLPHEILGNLYEKIGLKDQAIRELQKAVTLSQEHP